MPKDERTRDQLLNELATLRQKVASVEKSQSDNQKKTKKSLEEIESVFNHFLEHTPIYVFFKDAETRAIRLSKNYEQMLGKPMDELLNKTVYELFPTDLADNMYADDQNILRAGEVFQREEELDGRIYSTIKFPIRIEPRKEYIAGFTIDITENKKIENEYKKLVERLRTTLGTIVQVMTMTIEARDPYTAGHQRRVADLARSIAREMRLPVDQIDGLRMASLVHDIGKISIPSEILSKPTKLTDVEFALIKSHPQTGYNILKDIEFSSPIARIILEHHERLDGSGYPNGLTRDDLLIESRILAIADITEAMASHRPYRPGLGIKASLDEIRKGSGVCYDPDAVDACIRLFRDKGYKLKGDCSL